MYSTIQVANILEVEDRTVRNYIKKGLLIATMKDGKYQISIKDLEDFEVYFENGRFKNRSNKLNKEDFENLTAFIESVKSGISLNQLVTDYQKMNIKIPSLSVYMVHERNIKIKEDKTAGSTYEQLANKYKLCEKSISNILNSKEQI